VPGGISFDRAASTYDATRSLPPGVERTAAEVLARSLGDGRTLEIGVGTARWARPLEARGVFVAGVDLSRSMLEVARTKGFGRGVLGDVRRLPFRDATFAGVLSSHVLHLVYDLPAVLGEVARVSTGRLRSVLQFETARPDLMAAYIDLVERTGPRTGPPGLGERDLARRLPPDLVRDVATFHLRAPASAKLDALESRAFRDTWATPEQRHREVIEELRAKYGGADVLQETHLELAEWSRDRLATFARGWRMDRPAVGAPTRSTSETAS
jgi:SAM-dependent methyltransferase